MTTFASGTTVAVSRSRIELEELLHKWKADRVASGTEPGAAVVAFSIGKWHVRFRMPLPTEADTKDLRHRGYSLSPAQRADWIDQKTRERWRALVLTVKAKLVSVDNGVESFEEAFLAHLVLPGGATVGQKMLPQIEVAYADGQMPQLRLPGGT